MKKAHILLTLSLSFVYVWFGILKIFSISPVLQLIQSSFPTLPQPLTLHVLGIAEILIGIGLLVPRVRKFSVICLILHMGGIFSGLIMHPGIYFTNSNIFLPTVYGEFVAKNVVLVAAALVIYKET